MLARSGEIATRASAITTPITSWMRRPWRRRTAAKASFSLTRFESDCTVAAINTLSTTFAMLMASEYWPKASGEPSRRGKPTWTANAVTMKYSLAIVMNAIPLETPAFSDIRLVVSRAPCAVKKAWTGPLHGVRTMLIESSSAFPAAHVSWSGLAIPCCATKWFSIR
jgi:hypothetical protein